MHKLYTVALLLLLGSCSSGPKDISNQVVEYSMFSSLKECPLPSVDQYIANDYSVNINAIDKYSYEFTGKIVGNLENLKKDQLELIQVFEQGCKIFLNKDTQLNATGKMSANNKYHCSSIKGICSI